MSLEEVPAMKIKPALNQLAVAIASPFTFECPYFVSKLPRVFQSSWSKSIE
jgi:hypothetical protein